MGSARQLNVNIEQPRYAQSTFTGRAKHFFIITNPLNVFCSSATLEESKAVITAYRQGKHQEGLTEDKLWQMKNIYDSAFHPDTGEKMFLIGRMSAQVPMNMTITGCMMTFYRTTPAVVFWQWFNQSFNAVVNYTNRSGDSPLSVKQLGISYCLATGAAMTTALGLNRAVKNMPPLIGRYVPFAAVAAANCINIPFMRSKELQVGTPVFTEDGERVGESVTAARKGIAQVVFSRIVMAAPGMSIPPIIMARLEKGEFLRKNPAMAAPIQVGLVGILLVFATPLCCAIFPQKSSIKTSKLETELQDKLKAMGKDDDVVYFNKGL